MILTSLLAALALVPQPRSAVELGGVTTNTAVEFKTDAALPKENIFDILDLMALHKLNVLHWHLTEDEGWRLPTAKHPELVQYGASRVYDIVAASHKYGYWCWPHCRDDEYFQYRKAKI